MADDLTLAISLAAIVISVLGVVPLYLDYFARRKEKLLEKQVTFEVERFQESVSSPVESAWSIRVLRPSQTIEHCSVQLLFPSTGSNYSDQRVYLPVWNRKDVFTECKIPKDGGANFRIPKTVNPFGTLVAVIDRMGGVVALRDFREIPETTA